MTSAGAVRVEARDERPARSGALRVWAALGLGCVSLVFASTTMAGPPPERPEPANSAGVLLKPPDTESDQLTPSPTAPAAAAEPSATSPSPPTALGPAAAGPDVDAEEPALEPVVLEGGISVAVGRDQRATILGQTQSLRMVVEEICRQARIELRTYAAADRGYAGKLENVPLTEALRSMLRSESYLLGFHAGTDGGPARITWMRVLGGQPGANGATAIPAPVAAQFATPQPSQAKVAPPPSERFALSTALLFQAFGTYDPVRRDQAQRELLDRINQPDEQRRFLTTDTKQLVTLFGRYRDSEQTIRRLKSMSESPEVQAKFDEVLDVITAPEGGPTSR